VSVLFNPEYFAANAVFARPKRNEACLTKQYNTWHCMRYLLAAYAKGQVVFRKRCVWSNLSDTIKKHVKSCWRKAVWFAQLTAGGNMKLIVCSKSLRVCFEIDLSQLWFCLRLFSPCWYRVAYVKIHANTD